MKVGDLVRPTKPNDEIPNDIFRVTEIYDDRDMVYFKSLDGVFTHYLAPHQLEPMEPVFTSDTLQQIDAIYDFAKHMQTTTAYVAQNHQMFRLKTDRAIYRLVSDGTQHHVVLWRSHS